MIISQFVNLKNYKNPISNEHLKKSLISLKHSFDKFILHEGLVRLGSEVQETDLIWISKDINQLFVVNLLLRTSVIFIDKGWPEKNVQFINSFTLFLT
jgi:hypothetical protein